MCVRLLLLTLAVGYSFFPFPAVSQSGAPATLNGRFQCTGPHSGDAGDCRPRPEGTSRVIIEREIVYIHYPVIVWKRPSADGSLQSEFVNLQNPTAARAFDDFSRSTYQLYQRARVALNRGDCVAAAEYARAALKRNPPANEIHDLRSASSDAEDCVRKFKKTPTPDFLIIDVPDEKGIIKTLFDSERTDLEPARAKLLPLLKQQGEAKEQAVRLSESVKKLETANSSAAALEQQRAQLREAQAKQRKAEQEVKVSAEEINRTFEIVK